MQVLRIRSKFWGKSMEFQPEGEVGAKYFIYKIFAPQILSLSHILVQTHFCREAEFGFWLKHQQS